MKSKIFCAAMFALTVTNISAQVYKVQWQEQKSGLASSFRGLCAVNEKIAWVSGTRGSYARTADGGQTWLADSVAGATHLDFRDVQAFDANRAYLMSAGSGELSRIYKTVDGGKSWQLQHQNKIPEGFFDGMAFGDENNGVVIGDPVNGRLFILLTDDGGKNWQALPAEKSPAVMNGEYAFAASGTGIVARAKNKIWLATGGSVARVFYSGDRGHTWQAANTPIASGNQSSGIFSLAFRDEKHGVVIGGNYQQPLEAKANVALTDDGGKSWRLPKNSESVTFQSCVAFVPERATHMLVAVGTSGSHCSYDDGQTWIKFSDAAYHTLSFANSSRIGWAAGADGRIAKCVIAPNNVK
jgi:photosystem II stability/assembly factor-like uncharacterized protein